MPAASLTLTRHRPRRPLGLASFSLVSVAALAATGCTGAVAAGAGATPSGDADSAVTQAMVLVERTVDTSSPSEGTRAAVSARFARVAAGVTPADTLRALGAGLDLPARGQCAGITPTASLPSPDTSPAVAEPVPVVELLDMGRVSVEAAGAVTALVPRQLPYVTDVVTGTVYARAADAVALPAGAPYVFHVAGAADVPSFDVVGAAPQDASDVVIAQETTPGKVLAIGTGTGASIDFSWPAPSASLEADGLRDVVYVEVQPAGVRCTLGGEADPANGASHASIAASLLDDAGSLVVHRVHAQPLQAVALPRGVDGGELRFDFARVVAYARPSVTGVP